MPAAEPRREPAPAPGPADAGDGPAAERDRTGRGQLVAWELEVPTVTDTSVAFTWATYRRALRVRYGTTRPTAPAGETVLMGDVSGGPMRVVHEDPTPRGYHHVVVDGLEPGRAYRFECRSGDAVARPSLRITRRRGTPEATGIVTTAPALPGAPVGLIALTNDVHIGKAFHGGSPLDRSRLRDAGGARGFAAMQLAGVLAGAAADGADLVVANGDLTNDGTAAQVAEFTRLMDASGLDWAATRGNHDNRGVSLAEDPMLPACPPRQRPWVRRLGGLRLIGLDTSVPGFDGGHLDDAQLEELRAELDADPERPTIVFGHHPATIDAARSSAGRAKFCMTEEQSLRLQAILARAPGVAAVFSGHTHRSRRGVADVGNIDHCERGASLGYPGGYTLIRVSTGGYRVSFHRIPTRESLDWSARTRWSLLGMEPEYMLGTLADRNYTVRAGFDGLG